MKKYKIFLDSNQIYTDKKPLGEVFNSNISDLYNFLNKNSIKNVEICLPEIVIQERIQQRLENIEQSLSSANEIICSLRSVKHTTKEIKPRKDYKKILERNVNDFIKKHKLIRISTPSVNGKELIERAINKLKPFNDHGAGFKDTLIYLSIIEDALNPKTTTDRYIFCTNDGGFNNDVVIEFEKKTKKELYLLPSVTKVQEKLDELIPLNLHLERINQVIKNTILNHTGDLMHAINKKMFSPREYDPCTPSFGSKHYIGFNNITDKENDKSEENISGYNYYNLEIIGLDEINPNEYRVSVSVQTTIKYNDNVKPSNYGISTRRFFDLVEPNTVQYGYSQDGFMSYKPTIKTFNIEIKCDIESGEIIILSTALEKLFF